MDNNRRRVLDALHTVVASPEHHVESIAHYFAEDYQQHVDGHSLDYAQFVTHMAALKQFTQKMVLEIIAIAESGNSVLTHHQVTAEKRDGRKSLVEVFAHFRLREGKIYRCDEVTRLLQGAQEDADLGQRMA